MSYSSRVQMFADYCWLDYYQAVLKIKIAVLKVSLKFLNRALLDLSANSLDFLNRHSQGGLVQQDDATLLNGVAA